MRFRVYYQIVKWHLLAWTKMILRKEEDIIPYKMMVSITNLCNSRCKTCYIWQEGINHDEDITEFSIDEIVNVFKVLGKNLLWLSFTGGEPVLKIGKIKQILNAAKKYCPNLSIIAFTTNGLIPNRALELAHIIREHNLDSLITVSLDGDEATHDYIRGVKGNYKLAVQTMKSLKEDGFYANYGTTVSHYNIDKFLESEIARKAKAITFAHGDGIYGKENKLKSDKVVRIIENLIKNYRINKLAEMIELIYLKVGRKFFKRNREENIVSCRSFYTTLDFTPDGKIKPCMFLPDEFTSEDMDKNFFKREDVKLSRKKVVEGNCSKCWMNCYAPHSIMYNPVKSILRGLL